MNFGQKVLSTILVASAALTLLLVQHTHSRAGQYDAGALMVYCAASIKPPVVAAAAAFEERYGVSVALQFGGSGTLLSNIQVSDIGDLFVAADESYIQIARDKGLVGESLAVSVMTPVIGVAKGNPKRILSLDDLVRQDLRLALGNPDAASIGKHTQHVLSEAGLWEAVSRRINVNGVFKPTVGEIANAIKLGAVDAGIIWDATANQHDSIDAVHSRELDLARKRVTVGILRSSSVPTLALRFARYLTSPESKSIFLRMGYAPLDENTQEWALERPGGHRVENETR